jgi:hypothetical protein
MTYDKLVLLKGWQKGGGGDGGTEQAGSKINHRENDV